MKKHILYSLATSVLLVLAFPGFDIWITAWFALTPLLLVIKRVRAGEAFMYSYLAGIAFLMGVFSWINTVSGVTPFEFLVLGIYLGSYFAVFGGVTNIAFRNGVPFVLAAPVFWVAMEFLRSNAGAFGLPWALLGHSQYQNITMIQISSFTGVYGVSFIIVMFNAALADLLVSGSKSLRRFLPASILFLATLVFGVYSTHLSLPVVEKPNIAVIQGKVPQEIKWDPAHKGDNLRAHLEQTLEAVNASKPELVVWPETAVPGSFLHDLGLKKKISTFAQNNRVNMLFGSAQRPKKGSREERLTYWYNSAFLVAPNGAVAGRYNKIYLLPFAEYLPYEFFPWPEGYKPGSNYLQGEEYTLFPLGEIRIGVTICWENIFPQVFRKFVKKGAHIMVNITNEAWFEGTAAPDQFLSMSVFRAVENRVPVIRSANMGVSSFIGPKGGIEEKVEIRDRYDVGANFLARNVGAGGSGTFYTRFGDVFAIGNLALAVLLTAQIVLRRAGGGLRRWSYGNC
jgi:apolipoprotein N-acyltransferase